jgi:hypothetical protein
LSAAAARKLAGIMLAEFDRVGGNQMVQSLTSSPAT